MIAGKGLNRKLACAFLWLAGVIALAAVRSAWTFPIEHGDAVQKYFWAAEILRTGDWSLLLHNHHTIRWAVMFPQIAVTWLLGFRYEAFYLLPLLAFSATVVLLVFSLREVLDWRWRALLGLALFAEPQSFITSNQLLLPPFGVLYALAGAVILVRDGPRAALATAFAAGLFFLAYGAHVTYLGFAAGAVLWLLVERRFRRAGGFCLVILILMVCETLLINHLSDWRLGFGRIGFLAEGNHIQRMLAQDPVPVSALFRRWLTLPAFDLVLCAGFWLAGAWMAARRIMGRLVPGIVECIFFLGAAYAIAVTFAVAELAPLRPALGFRTMYLMPFLPLAVTLTMYLLSEISAPFSIRRYPVREAVILAAVAGILVFHSRVTWVLTPQTTAFAWQAQAQYSRFARRFGDGEIALGGQRREVYALIARYSLPVEIRRSDRQITPVTLKAGHLCMQRLNLVPLDRNFHRCTRMAKSGAG